MVFVVLFRGNQGVSSDLVFFGRKTKGFPSDFRGTLMKMVVSSKKKWGLSVYPNPFWGVGVNEQTRWFKGSNSGVQSTKNVGLANGLVLSAW